MPITINSKTHVGTNFTITLEDEDHTSNINKSKYTFVVHHNRDKKTVYSRLSILLEYNSLNNRAAGLLDAVNSFKQYFSDMQNDVAGC